MDKSCMSDSVVGSLKAAYTYNQMIITTHGNNENLQDIVVSQLSLVKIETGSNVLLVGGKGGYINFLVAQIVGVNGKVVTVSSCKDILETCKARVDANSPLKSCMEWKLISSVQD